MTLNYWAVSFIGRIVRFFRPTPYTNETRLDLLGFGMPIDRADSARTLPRDSCFNYTTSSQ